VRLNIAAITAAQLVSISSKIMRLRHLLGVGRNRVTGKIIMRNNPKTVKMLNKPCPNAL
jgi:hypothetical protein